MDTKYLEIIKAPVVTEKSTKLNQDENKYEIKNAVEKIFKVKVVDISTINAKTKKKRVGRYSGLTNRYKKAVVTLSEGQTIELK